MLHYLKDYPSEFRRDLNIPLMNKEWDRPLIEYVLDSWKSLEIIKGIEFLDYEYTEDESKIDINKYIYKRQKGKKQNEKYDYKFIDDTRVGLLTVRMKLSVVEKDFKKNQPYLKEKIIKKSMLIPLQDEKGYYYVKGKKYYLIYQMVEKSTYTSINSVILKSLMPFAIRRQTINCEDVHEQEYTIPYFTIDLFRKDIPVMLIYASKGGLDYAIQYAIKSYPYVAINFVTKTNMDDKKYIYFQISTKLFLKVHRKLFENFQYLQSVVGGILFICTNRVTINKINDTSIFIKKLSSNNIEKGQKLLDSLKRLLDETTKKILRVDISNKMDVLSVIRWMTEEFNELRMKDNMNLNNKRLRCNEYIASLLTQDWSRKLNRTMALGSKITMDNLIEIFKFPGDILLQKMHSSGVFRFDDTINDMDFFSRFKYTNKGPHSAGTKNSNTIGIRYRGIHPSFISKIDLTVCSNSDPGLSGVLSPFCKMDGLSFDDSEEPDNFRFEFLQAIKEVIKEEGIDSVDLIFDTKDEYYKYINIIHNYNMENVHCHYEKIKKDYVDVIVDDEEDLDEPIPALVPTTKKTNKKKK